MSEVQEFNPNFCEVSTAIFRGILTFYKNKARTLTKSVFGAVVFADNAAMTNQSIVPAEVAKRFEVHEWRNGLAILSAAHPQEWSDIIAVLKGFRLLKSDILKPGGSKGLISSSLDTHFTKLGWVEKKFDTKIVVDKSEFITPTHKVDCYKNRVALEVEWNNKDPFFDRDLNNFRLLFDLRASMPA